IVLRKKDPAMERPFRLPGGTIIGWIAVFMSIGVAILYMPGMPSALVWPYEWIIIFVWAALGLIFYKRSISTYGQAHADEHLHREIDRVMRQNAKENKIDRSESLLAEALFSYSIVHFLFRDLC